MGREIKFGVLVVIFSIFFCSVKDLNAQNIQSADTLRNLEELVISIERPTPFQPLVRVVAVIRKADIERAAVNNLQDLLKYVQGVDIRSRGSEGVQADINILGGTFDQTMVMINGINFTDPQTGHHSLNIPVTISQIERVEVLQGPGAWSEGSVAYSGAINIVTKDPSAKEKSTSGLSGEGSLSGGSYGYFRGEAGIGFNGGKGSSRGWSVSGIAGGDYSRSDGYTTNTDFNILNLYSAVTLKSGSGHSVKFQAGYQDKAFGANSFYTIAYPEQFEKTRLFLSSAQYLFESKSWQISASAYQRRHFDRFELFRYESPSWYKGHNYHMNDIAGVSAKVAHRWGSAGTSVIGADFRYEHIYSTVLGDPLDNNRPAPFEDGVEYTKAKGRNTTSLYLKHILQLNKWRFTAGLMGSGNRLYAGIATAFTVNPYLEINGWLNNSYRNPTFTDLYYKSPTQTGNMNLKPEEAVAAQLGLRYTNRIVRASLSSFYRYGYRIIDWTRESLSDQWSASNITNVSTFGIEVNINILPVSEVFKNIGISYAWLETAKKSGGLHSLYATDYLRHKAALFVDHNILGKLNARWDLSLFKRAGTYLGPGNTETPYGTYLLADVRIMWSSRNITPYIEATNLFNTQYLYIGNLPQPGRWIKGGVKFAF
ncbi:hypothetical protein MASR2M69_18100 [Bacteroidota bacterium]